MEITLLFDDKKTIFSICGHPLTIKILSKMRKNFFPSEKGYIISNLLDTENNLWIEPDTTGNFNKEIFAEGHAYQVIGGKFLAIITSC